MFIKTCTDTIGNQQVNLAFLKSLNVKAFPCGKRRSPEINQVRIPFDPEARLNTEANNLKSAALNGFSTTFLHTRTWDTDTDVLTLSMAGYFFNIDLDNDYRGPAAFCEKLSEQIGELDNVYVNILIEDIQLFVGEPKAYYTSVLSSLCVADTSDNTALDLADPNTSSTKNDYYFSGLAFSKEPLTAAVRSKYEAQTYDVNTYDDFSFIDDSTGTPISKRVVSLRILEKVKVGGTDTWQINRRALLPKIEHGNKDDTVVIKDLAVADLNATTLTVDTQNATSLVAESITATDTATVDGTLTVKTEQGEGVIDADTITAEVIDAVTIIQNGKAVPTIDLATVNGKYQLQIKLSDN